MLVTKFVHFMKSLLRFAVASAFVLSIFSCADKAPATVTEEASSVSQEVYHCIY